MIDYKVIQRLSGPINYDGHLGNLILIDKHQSHEFPEELTWNEKKQKVDLFNNKYKYSREVLKEEIWNIKTFKRFQSNYIKQFGKLYKIGKLKNFQFESESDVIVEDDSINTGEIYLAASEISKCIRNNLNSLNEKKIRDSIKSIDGFKQKFMQKKDMLDLMVRLRTKHKIYKRRYTKTFLKWVNIHSKGSRCDFTKVFLDNQSFFPSPNTRDYISNYYNLKI